MKLQVSRLKWSNSPFCGGSRQLEPRLLLKLLLDSVAPKSVKTLCKGLCCTVATMTTRASGLQEKL